MDELQDKLLSKLTPELTMATSHLENRIPNDNDLKNIDEPKTLENQDESSVEIATETQNDVARQQFMADMQKCYNDPIAQNMYRLSTSRPLIGRNYAVYMGELHGYQRCRVLSRSLSNRSCIIKGIDSGMERTVSFDAVEELDKYFTSLTDEEIMLRAKYAKLRKKKDALQAYQNPKPEPEKINSLKRALEPKEAKEYAKKLVLSGKITVPTKPSSSKLAFKKPQGLLRKLSETKAAAVVAPVVNPDGGAFQSSSTVTGVSSGVQFKPFTPSPSSSSNSSTLSDTGSYNSSDSRRFSQHGTGRRRYNYNFNSNEEDGDRNDTNNTSGNSANQSGNRFGGGNTPFRNSGSFGGGNGDFRPKQGKTIHVRGLGTLTEELCREAFNNIGSIVNVSMELDRNCGFVTFTSVESAEKAIQELNGSYVGSTKLTVSFARRQFPLSEMGEGTSAGLAWATISSNPSHKSSFKDKRSAVVYDDCD